MAWGWGHLAAQQRKKGLPGGPRQGAAGLAIARARSETARAAPSAPPAADAAEDPAPRRVAPGRERCCMWPMGDPRASGFRFCAAPPITNKPYCPEHYARAYVGIPEEEEV